jgi:hypothetical protein
MAMHYKRHIFMCVNQKPADKRCCNDINAFRKWATGFALTDEKRKQRKSMTAL